MPSRLSNFELAYLDAFLSKNILGLILSSEELHGLRNFLVVQRCQEYPMKEMKDMMLRQNETVLQQGIARADGQQAAIESNLQQSSVGGGTHLSEESEQSRQELLREIRQQQVSNDTVRGMCEEALSRTVYERVGQKIKGVKATNYSAAVAGFINTSGEALNIAQDISDVTADNWSVAAAGAIKNVDFKDLRPSAPTYNMGYRQQ